MRDVSSFSDTVDYEVVESFQFLEFFFLDMVHVCAVRQVSEAVAQNWKFVMSAADRYYFYSVYFERIFINEVHVPFWGSWVFVLCKCI